MKKVLFTFYLFSALILIGFQAKAQQEYQVSHNMFNQLSVNPAYAGNSGAICGGLIHRQQWLGLEGKPVTSVLSLDAPVNLLGPCGVGLNIVSDKLGVQNNIGLKLALAKKLPMASGTLGIGVQAGFYNQVWDFSEFKPIDLDDQILNSTKVEKDMLFDLALGLHFSIPGKLYVGLSSSQIMQSEGEFSTKAKPTFARHYFFTGGYTHHLNPVIDLEPSIMVKSDLSSTQIDINCLALYNQKVWGGLSYRMEDALAFMVGFVPIKNMKAGISYDFTTSAIGRSGRSSGSVEVYLGYCLKVERTREPSSYRNSRFL